MLNSNYTIKEAIAEKRDRDMGNMWHVKNWFRVGHNISWALNFHTLFGFLYLYRPFNNRFSLNQAEKKHKFIFSYLRKEHSDIIEKYRDYIEPTSVKPQHRYIWTLWWQGEETAPPLIKACFSSIRENANGAELVILTKDNYRDYIELPEYILEKREKGYISFAQLSDIFRFTLLEKYGGLWLDSTIYTSKPIPESYFERSFFSQHTKWAETCFVQHNLFHGFIIGSQKNGKLVSFVKEMFFEYWKKHDTLVDYLMIDYLIMLAYQEYPDIKDEIDSLDYSSERLYDLVNMLSKPYNEAEFSKLKADCIFSKLDWHRKYKTETNGKKTYYSMLINDASIKLK